MLNKYVGWLFKYVEWLSQLENYRICVGKLRGHFCSCFLFFCHSHFTYSIRYFLVVSHWVDCSLIIREARMVKETKKAKKKKNLKKQKAKLGIGFQNVVFRFKRNL